MEFEIWCQTTFSNTLPRTEKILVSAENGFSGANTLPRTAPTTSLNRYEAMKIVKVEVCLIVFSYNLGILMMIYSPEVRVWTAPACRGPGRGCPPSPPPATCRPPPAWGRRPRWTWWGRGPGTTSGTSRGWPGGSSGCPDQTMCSQIYSMWNKFESFINVHFSGIFYVNPIFSVHRYCRYSTARIDRVLFTEAGAETPLKWAFEDDGCRDINPIFYNFENKMTT